MTAAVAPAGSAPDRRFTPWWVMLLSGLALVFVGIWLWSQPVRATLFLWQVVGWYWLIMGILNIVMIFVDSTKWGWKLALGVIGIIAGLWIIQNPVWGAVGGTAAIVLVLGIQAIIYGIVAMIASFQGAGWGSLVLGIISIVLGFVLLGNFWAATLVTPWVVAIFAIVGGVFEIVASFMQRSRQKAAA